MLHDIQLARRAACSTKDKESLIPLIKKLKEYSELSRREGLLAIEDDIPNMKNEFIP